MFLQISTFIAQAVPTEVPLGSFNPPTEAYSAGSDTRDGALENLEGFISNLIGFLTVLASLFFVIYFVVGAFNWVTSGGDKGKLESARNRMLYGVLGMIIIIASYAILGVLSNIVGLDLLNPGNQIRQIIPGASTL